MSNNENKKELFGILDNPIIKNLALGKVRKAFKEHAVTLITIDVDTSGELQFEVYTEPMKVMTQTDFNKTINSML